MAGAFVFISRTDARRLLKVENPYMYEMATKRTMTEVRGKKVDVETFSPEIFQENYMESTGAKLYFYCDRACIMGYHYAGNDVTDLLKKHNIKTMN